MARALVRAGAASGAVGLALALVLAAEGLLYVLRGALAWPGPAVGEALPLDELARSDSVGLLLFVLVWGTVGLLLGLLVRALAAPRLPAALGLAIGVGLWQYLETGLSILTVRQVPAHEAFRAAAALPAVYVPGVLAGLGGALLARNRGGARSARAPVGLALACGAVGVLGLFRALLPAEARRDTLERLLPHTVHTFGSAVVAPLGLALLLLARPLALGKRRAWQLAVVLLALSTALHLLYGFTLGAAASGLLWVALLAQHRSFRAGGDSQARPRALLRLALLAAVVWAYGLVAIWANRALADQPVSLDFAFRQTVWALAGQHPHLVGDFATWFVVSVPLLTAIGLVWVLTAWLAPRRFRQRRREEERELARRIVSTAATDTLAPFTLRRDKAYFFDADRRAFLAYRVVAGVALVSGDPVGPPEAVPALLRRFLDLAHEQGWQVAVLDAGGRYLELYERLGLRAIYHGDEAIVDSSRFTLDGRRMRKVRQSVKRLERAGYRVEFRYAGELDRELLARLEEVERRWRDGEPRRGYAMELDTLDRLGGSEALFAIAWRQEGRPEAFLHLAVAKSGSALSLSSMPRLRSTPNGLNEWLVSRTILWAREHGIRRVSLNFIPFAEIFRTDASFPQRLQAFPLRLLKGRFQRDNLLAFNRKFQPSYERRYLVVEGLVGTPRAAAASLAAEGFLPTAGGDA